MFKSLFNSRTSNSYKYIYKITFEKIKFLPFRSTNNETVGIHPSNRYKFPKPGL